MSDFKSLLKSYVNSNSPLVRIIFDKLAMNGILGTGQATVIELHDFNWVSEMTWFVRKGIFAEGMVNSTFL